jgi:hypothetical protein
MPVAVVDLLQAVQIGQGHAHRVSALVGLPEVIVHGLLQEAPRVQARQPILEGFPVAGGRPHADPDPRQQLLHLEGLGQVVVGARVEPPHLVLAAVSCGQQHHVGAGVEGILAESGACLRFEATPAAETAVGVGIGKATHLRILPLAELSAPTRAGRRPGFARGRSAGIIENKMHSP